MTWGLDNYTSNGTLNSDCHDSNGANVPDVRIIEYIDLANNLLKAIEGSKHHILIEMA